MAQWIKGTAAKADNLSSIPGTHMVRRRQQNPTSCLLTFMYILWVCMQGHTCTRVHTHTAHTHTQKTVLLKRSYVVLFGLCEISKLGKSVKK